MTGRQIVEKVCFPLFICSVVVTSVLAFGLIWCDLGHTNYETLFRFFLSGLTLTIMSALCLSVSRVLPRKGRRKP